MQSQSYRTTLNHVRYLIYEYKKTFHERSKNNSKICVGSSKINKEPYLHGFKGAHKTKTSILKHRLCLTLTTNIESNKTTNQFHIPISLTVSSFWKIYHPDVVVDIMFCQWSEASGKNTSLYVLLLMAEWSGPEFTSWRSNVSSQAKKPKPTGFT